MRSLFASLIVGFIFAIGLGISGMAQPQKVLAFLDIFGAWDPALMFVMIGALVVHMILFPLIMRRSKPLLTNAFHIPKRRDVDFKLLAGATLFGLGWGIAGYCPAPALTATATLTLEPLAFVLSMVLGMCFYMVIDSIQRPG